MRARSSPLDALNKTNPIGIQQSGKAYRAVVVDDSSIMRKIVSRCLMAEAFDICAEGATGSEAIELYKLYEPDLMTLDINMPEMNGIEALKKILEFNSKACVVMLTSEAHKDTVMEAIAIGARGYIVKPPERIAVIETLKRALRIP